MIRYARRLTRVLQVGSRTTRTTSALKIAEREIAMGMATAITPTGYQRRSKVRDRSVIARWSAIGSIIVSKDPNSIG